MKVKKVYLLACVGMLSFTTVSLGQEGQPGATGRAPVSAGGGLGFTLDPDLFLFSLHGDYSVTRNFSLGPLLQLGVSGNRTLVAPTINFKGVFDLPSDLSQLKPFVQGGLGFAYLHKDHRRGDNDDIGFMFNLGFGADYYVTDRISLGSNVLFNIIPDKTLGENFFFSWELASFSYHF